MLKEYLSQKSTERGILTVAGVLIAACFTHHVFSIWDRKALWILLAFLLLSPLFTLVLSFIYAQSKSAFQQIQRKRSLFLVSALVLGSLATWATYRAPVSYQTITFEPQLYAHQRVELLEIKVGGDIYSLEEKALEAGWNLEDGMFTATQDSDPLILTFPVPLRSTVSILFNSSVQSGRVSISYGSMRRAVDLSTSNPQQKLITLHSQYRAVPNWLFVPFLVIADMFTFSFLFLLIFILQEKGQRKLIEDHRPEKFFSHQQCVLILVSVAVILHLLNALAVPLIVDSDSPAYLQGAVHLLQYGNLKGVSVFCGPGTTFLFAPVLYVFGRNPWGMKILLHLIAIASVLVSYRIGWQLSHKRWVAFCIGFLTILIPEFYYYSNFVMSEIPTIFLILLSSSLLLDALADFSFQRILLAFGAISLATLLREENILVFIFGIVCLGSKPAWEWFNGFFDKTKKQQKHSSRSPLAMLFWAALIALIPVLWLSFFNYQVHEFLGLNASSGVVLYGGWVYYPEASGFDFRDESSLAVQEIDRWIEKYPIDITDGSGVATPGEIYPSLIKAGFSSQQAFDLFEQAAQDSIVSHKNLVPAVLKLKLRDAFRPEILHTTTFPLPAETAQVGKLYTDYFDPSNLSIPNLINLQRAFYDWFNGPAAAFYRSFILVALFTMFLSLYRTPFRQWVLLALITATRIFIPNLMSVANWRYTVTGIPLLLIFAVIGFVISLFGIKDVFIRSKQA